MTQIPPGAYSRSLVAETRRLWQRTILTGRWFYCDLTVKTDKVFVCLLLQRTVGAVVHCFFVREQAGRGPLLESG